MLNFSKTETGYEKDPPRCGNCQNIEKEDKRRYCRVFGFKVVRTGICDHWEGRKGELLENKG